MLLNIKESKIFSVLIMSRVEKGARRYKVQVRYIRPSTRIRDIFQAPILLHTLIRITIPIKICLLPSAHTHCFSLCPTLMKNIHRANLGFVIALFRVISQRVVVIPYRRFATTYRFHLQGSRMFLKVEQIGCPEMSVKTATICCIISQKGRDL
jgi:hypothetical protein